MVEKERSEVRRRILKWYAANKRTLPWRKNKNPYYIWLSEIMLQQTQVDTVIPYYLRFIKTFPTVQSLAQGSLQSVLKLWEGLGYYSRARNLHRAAKTIQRDYHGRIPKDKTLLAKLPGIGPSTAGAILSIAFGRREAILDGNVKRVLCRLYSVPDDPKNSAVVKKLWKYSGDLLPVKKASDFNQALMDLGATVCTPKNPHCLLCPLQENCSARAKGLQNLLPLRALRKKMPHREFVIGIVQNMDAFLIQQRPHNGLLGGLWEFPTFERPGSREGLSLKEVEQHLRKQVGIQVKPEGPLTPVPHTYTHFKATYFPFRCRGKGRPSNTMPRKWVTYSEFLTYPTSRVTQKLIQSFSPSFPALENPSELPRRKRV